MTNFLLPFQLTAQGGVATTDDPQVIARQRVNSLIGTSVNGRVMLQDYGTNIPLHLFDPDVANSMDEISTDIQNQLQVWEPSINVIGVSLNNNQAAQGIAQINVQFTQSNDPSFTPVLTATVLPGGTVVNN